MEENNMNKETYRTVTIMVWFLTAVMYTISGVGFLYFMAYPPTSFEFYLGLMTAAWGATKGYELNIEVRKEARRRRAEYWEKHGE